MDSAPSSIKLKYFVSDEEERTVVPDTWLKLNQDETPEYKGKPYLDATPTVLTKFWLVFPCGVALAYLYGGKQEVYTCFNPDVLWGMLPCGFLFSIADVSEILAQGGIDPTTYIVLSQARLLLTAVVMKIRIGKGQTTLQWMDLMILTIMIIVFQMMPNDFFATKPKGATVKDNALLGVVMTMAKVLLSVYAGVAQQKAMQGGGAAGKCSFIAQVTAQQVGGIPAILLALPLCCVARGTPLGVYGFWGGPDGGWDHRTWERKEDRRDAAHLLSRDLRDEGALAGGAAALHGLLLGNASVNRQEHLRHRHDHAEHCVILHGRALRLRGVEIVRHHLEDNDHHRQNHKVHPLERRLTLADAPLHHERREQQARLGENNVSRRVNAALSENFGHVGDGEEETARQHAPQHVRVEARVDLLLSSVKVRQDHANWEDQPELRKHRRSCVQVRLALVLRGLVLVQLQPSIRNNLALALADEVHKLNRRWRLNHVLLQIGDFDFQERLSMWENLSIGHGGVIKQELHMRLELAFYVNFQLQSRCWGQHDVAAPGHLETILHVRPLRCCDVDRPVN